MKIKEYTLLTNRLLLTSIQTLWPPDHIEVMGQGAGEMLPSPCIVGLGAPPPVSGRDAGKSRGKQRGAALGELAGRCPGRREHSVGRVQGFTNTVGRDSGVSQLTAVSKPCSLMKILGD